MTRALVICEGQTEQTFVHRVLKPALWESSALDLGARLVGEPGRKGGNSWSKIQRDVERSLKGDPRLIVTTCFDLFRLPPDFPGVSDGTPSDPYNRVEQIERAFAAHVQSTMSNSWDTRWFVPYVQLHEFEALLFSDVPAFARALGRLDRENRLAAIRAEFRTPELINDGPSTSPSKRLLSLVPSYRKVADGVLAAEAIGLAKLRHECQHFDRWLIRLEEATGTTRRAD